MKSKTIDEIKQIYEKKIGKKIKIYNFKDKDVLLKYIEKYELYSSSAEVLLKDKDVLLKYIEKWKLDSSSAEIIFSILKMEEM